MEQRLRPMSSRQRVKSLLEYIRGNISPGYRLLLGVLLIIGGVLGFLPILGFWMIPFGVAVAAMDIQPFRQFLVSLRGQRR